MKILLVGTSLGTGGVQGVIAQEALGLAARGHEVRVLGLYGTETLRQLGPEIPQLALGLPTGANASLAKAVPLVRRAIRHFGPDVVHSHQVHATAATRLARIGNRWPLVSTIHSAQEGGRAQQALARALFALSDVTTVVSEAARDANEASGAAPAGRLRVVHNGLDLTGLGPDPSSRERTRAALGVRDEPLVLAVGRLAPAKDFPTLVRALALVRAQEPRVRAVLAGDGDERGAVEAAMADAGPAGTVELLGTRTDVPDLMRAADVFVMSSAWEGLPLVAGEAMAARTRLVTTDVPGTLEIAGGTALVGHRGDPQSLADALLTALREPAPAREAALDAARLRVEQEFTADVMVERYLEVFDEVRDGR